MAGVTFLGSTMEYDEPPLEYFQDAPLIDLNLEPTASLLRTYISATPDTLQGSQLMKANKDQMVAPIDYDVFSEEYIPPVMATMGSTSTTTLAMSSPGVHSEHSTRITSPSWPQSGSVATINPRQSLESIAATEVQASESSSDTFSTSAATMSVKADTTDKTDSTKTWQPTGTITETTTSTVETVASKLVGLTDREMKDLVKRGIISDAARVRARQLSEKNGGVGIGSCFDYCPCKCLLSIFSGIWGIISGKSQVLPIAKLIRDHICQLVGVASCCIHIFRSLAYWIMYIIHCSCGAIKHLVSMFGLSVQKSRRSYKLKVQKQAAGIMCSSFIWTLILMRSVKIVPGLYYIQWQQTIYGGSLDLLMAVTSSPQTCGATPF